MGSQILAVEPIAQSVAPIAARGEFPVYGLGGGLGARYTMANNYNGARRIPVVFASDGAARLVVRRETLADLLARDVD